MSLHEVEKQLAELIDPECVFVGIGNRMCGDDGFGPLMIELLQKSKSSLKLIDAGMSPENHLIPIINHNPQTVIILDAVSLDAPPGSVHLLTPDDLEPIGASTHSFSLDLISSFIQQSTDTKLYILGVVPLQTSLHKPISPEIQSIAIQLTNLITKSLIRLSANAEKY